MDKNSSKKNLLHFIDIVTNLYLFLSLIIFCVYLIIPLFGGIFSAKALVIYGSWIGMALVIKYLINKFKKDIKLKWYEILFLTLYAIFCMFLWFPLPFNILFSILAVIGNIIGYRAQIKSTVKEK